MNSGWAVVIGAAIALLGSAIVPWIRESLTGRSQRARLRREELSAAITAVVQAAAKRLANEGVKDVVDSELAMLRLSLLMTPKDSDLVVLVENAFMDISRSNPLAASAFVDMAELLALWFRGEITSAAALEKYNAESHHPPENGVG